MTDTQTLTPKGHPKSTDPAGACLRFPRGILGFPDAKAFTLTQSEMPGVFILEGREPSAPAFVVVDPFAHFDRYEVDLSDSDLQLINAFAPSDISILCIAIPDLHSGCWTANLQGPLAVNVRDGLGTQAVLPSGAWGVRHAFSPLVRPVDPAPVAASASRSVGPEGVLVV